jgi:hypothetical protein
MAKEKEEGRRGGENRHHEREGRDGDQHLPHMEGDCQAV